MDTQAPSIDKATEEQRLSDIKDRMPDTYAAIHRKAGEIGKQAFNLVRRAVRGEPDCFYAIERGRVAGTPFCQAVMAEVAVQMVEFGCTYLCIWPMKDGGDGKA